MVQADVTAPDNADPGRLDVWREAGGLGIVEIDDIAIPHESRQLTGAFEQG